MKKRVWGTYFSSAASSRVRVFARFRQTVERHPRTPGRALPGQRDGDGYTMAVSSHDGIDHERKNLCVDEASAAGVKGAAERRTLLRPPPPPPAAARCCRR